VPAGAVGQGPGAAALLLGLAASLRCGWQGTAGRLCCSAFSAVRAHSGPWFGVTGVSFPHRLQEDAQSLSE